jgi:hypothetical protein
VHQRERAWDDIHSWLPDGWRVTAPSWDPGRRRREVVARSPKPVGRLSRPDYLIADGEDELHALTELALKLDAIRRAERVVAIEERARLAFVAGAEEESRRTHRRGLTAVELEAILERYPVL